MGRRGGLGKDSGQQGGQKMDLKKRGTAGFEGDEGKQQQAKEKKNNLKRSVFSKRSEQVWHFQTLSSRFNDVWRGFKNPTASTAAQPPRAAAARHSHAWEEVQPRLIRNFTASQQPELQIRAGHGGRRRHRARSLGGRTARSHRTFPVLFFGKGEKGWAPPLLPREPPRRASPPAQNNNNNSRARSPRKTPWLGESEPRRFGKGNLAQGEREGAMTAHPPRPHIPLLPNG